MIKKLIGEFLRKSRPHNQPMITIYAACREYIADRLGCEKLAAGRVCPRRLLVDEMQSQGYQLSSESGRMVVLTHKSQKEKSNANR